MIVLRNCTLVRLHPAEVRAGVDIRIEGTEIAAVSPGAGSRRATDKESRTLDLGGRIVMPGLVCGHTHFYSALSRGILARIGPCPDFVSRLANLWWRLDRSIDEDILRSSAMVAAVEAVRAGCTAVIDHHASPSFIEGSLDVLKASLETVGLRGVLCYETTDRNGRDGMEQGIAENERFARLVEAEKGARGKERLVEAMIGGHAAFTIPDEGLRSLGEVVGRTGRGFHVHAAEDAFDPSYSHRYHGKDLLARLDGFGLLAQPALVAHGLYLSAEDREALNRKGAALAHNSRSNMNNCVGYNSSLADLRRVVLGTDGIGADMLEEAKFAYFKNRDAGGTLTPGDVTRFLQAGSDVLTVCFGERFGRVEEGFKADLAILDYDPPTPLAAENLAGHLVFGMGSASVDTVIVNGRMVMENRRFTWDTGSVFAEARRQASRLWKEMDRL
ncbi:MAG: putative aminohydrolase SsnA [Acidobacteria bacterium]|nr:putative aminohydrolase SsnA [Acidobacteriota bacterium]